MTPGGRLVILSLKHGRDPIELRIQVLSRDGRARGARDVLASVLQYVLETSQVEQGPLRELLVRQVGQKEADEMLSTADRLRSEGRAQGVAKGKREALLLLLRQRFGRLPAATVVRVDKASLPELDAWFVRGLTAESLDEVLTVTRRPVKAKPKPAAP